MPDAFVTTTTARTAERQYNKPILIMTSDRPNRQRPKPFEKVNPKTTAVAASRPVIGEQAYGDLPSAAADKPHFDYDYYDENDDQFLGKIRAQVKYLILFRHVVYVLPLKKSVGRKKNICFEKKLNFPLNNPKRAEYGP